MIPNVILLDNDVIDINNYICCTLQSKAINTTYNMSM